MGQKYAVHKDGVVTGHFDASINKDIPPGAVAITTDQWHLSMAGKLRIEKGVPVEYDPPEKTLEAAKNDAVTIARKILSQIRDTPESYRMAAVYQSGLGDSRYSTNGLTASEYLEHIGASLGKTPDEMVSIILSDTAIVAGKILDAETEYWGFVISILPGIASLEELDVAINDFKRRLNA